MTQRYDIKGMHCASCQAIVEKTVKALDGVNSVEVSLLLNSAEVDFDEKKISAKQIAKAIKDAGFEASVKKNFLRKLIG